MTVKEAGKQIRVLPVLVYYGVYRNILFLLLLLLDDLYILLSPLVKEYIKVAGGKTCVKEKHFYQSVTLYAVITVICCVSYTLLG